MKQKLCYAVLSIVITGIVSFKTISNNRKGNAEAVMTIEKKFAGGIVFHYKTNGSIQQIIWRENAVSIFSKSFIYTDNKIKITEAINGKAFKEEMLIMNGEQLLSLKGKQMDSVGKTTNVYNLQYYYNDDGSVEKVMYENGGWHKYVYDNKDNLIETRWYNLQGDLVATSRKQYFPKLPDQFTQYKATTNNQYASFFSSQEDNSSVYNRMANKIATEISFDGKNAFVLSTDGYISAGKWMNNNVVLNN